MGWGIALVVILLLAVLPLSVKFRYGADGLTMKACVGFLTVWKSSAGKSKNHTKKKEKKKKSHLIDAKKKQPEERSGGSLLDFRPLVRLALDFLTELRKKLRITRMDAELVLAGDDPCDLAINYGRVWAAIGNLIPVLERNLIIKKRCIHVGCDFTAEQTYVTANLNVSITLGRTIYLAMKYGVRGVREYQNITKSRKGGTVL